MADDPARDARVAANELAFRGANEALRPVFETVEDAEPAEDYPFLCECGERRCTEVVAISLEAYGRVRANPTHFVIVPGHKQLDSERILESHDGHQVIEKTGVPGDLARDAWRVAQPEGFGA